MLVLLYVPLLYLAQNLNGQADLNDLLCQTYLALYLLIQVHRNLVLHYIYKFLTTCLFLVYGLSISLSI